MRARRALREAAETAVLMVVVLIAALVVAPRVLSTDVPLAVVASYSMEPSLRLGDLILVNGAAEPRLGDVIVYVSPRGSLIVHRVVEVRETLQGIRYITKGDANLAPDADPVPAERVKGRVDLVVPYVGVARLALERFIQGVRGSPGRG